MSLAQPMKQEPEFALREDNIIKDEKFEANEEVLQAEVTELEYEESETKAEPDSEDCSDPVILKDNDELMMDGNQPLCVVSEITTLDHNCVKQSTIDKLAVTDKIFSRRPKASSLHHTDTRVDKKTKINMTKVVQLVLTSDTTMKTDVDTCRLCQKSTMKKYKYCSSCENVGAYRQLNSLYKRPQLPLMEDDGVFSLKLCEQKSQDAKVMEKWKIKYPIRECWVRLERCDAENTARLHTNAVITQSANCQTDKPYHCETCNGKLDRRQFCQTCKNLNPVSLKTDVLRTRLITKMNLTKVSRNEKDFQRSTGGGKKSYACEICKTTIYNNQRFCPACAREVASRQLLTIIK